MLAFFIYDIIKTSISIWEDKNFVEKSIGIEDITLVGIAFFGKLVKISYR